MPIQGIGSQQSTKTEVSLILLDADGCTIPAYFGSFDPIKLKSVNQNLLQCLSDEFAEKQYQRIIFGLGTNRQDFDLDSCNARKNSSCSCAFLLPFFQKYFQEDGSNKVLIDPIMMGDIFSYHNKDSAHNSVEPGSTYAITLLNGRSQQRDFFKTKFDDYKISLLYMHAHRVACLNPHSNITINFFDDRTDILEVLHKFFNDHPDFLPSNVELRLKHYENRSTVKQYRDPIKGIGLCDQQYDRTVQLMSYATPTKHASDALQGLEIQIYENFLEYINKGCRLYLSDEDDYLEEPCRSMHTQFLFRNIEKQLFLKVRYQIGSHLTSGLHTNGYPNDAVLLEAYNALGDRNLSLAEFQKILYPKPLTIDSLFDDEPPYGSSVAVSTHRALDYSNGENDGADRFCVFPPHFSLRNSNGNDLFSRDGAITPDPSPSSHVSAATFFTPRNLDNDLDGGAVDVDNRDRRQLPGQTGEIEDLSVDNIVPEPTTTVAVLPEVPFPVSPVSVNNSGDTVLQHSFNSKPVKKTPGFFERLFGAGCCGEDSCRVRENIHRV